MKHALILPILLPMFAGALLLAAARMPLGLRRGVSLGATWLLLPLSVLLLAQASDGQLRVYALGGWQPPFGIVLLLDRLSALMLLVTAVLGGFVALYACRGDDQRGSDFHALLQFQLMGINGAFLTGDLFNLFVFFEILLIASYCLLLHGGGAQRVRAGMHYVLLNLLGSSFFLLGVGTLYGLTGTLNMADLALRIGQAGAGETPLLAAAGFLLLVVFALKAAVLPLCFWLPRAYASATAPVAALFAIMTKVGLYAILRVFTLLYGSEAGELANLARDWLWPLALLTVIGGALGALGARTLQMLLGYLMILSIGTLLAGIALGSPASIAALLYYLIHSTLISAGLFLLADLIARQRGERAGELVAGPALQQPLLLGGLFFVGAIAIAGLPPFSGFIGKLLLLRAAPMGHPALLLWTVLLSGGFCALVALSRAGSTLFWRGTGQASVTPERDPLRLIATSGLLLGAPLLVLGAGPLQAYLQATAEQLLDLAPYLRIVGGGA